MKERLDVLRKTRKGLCDHQILWAGVGELSETAIEEAANAKRVGASAVITMLPGSGTSYGQGNQRCMRQSILTLADQMALPTIIGLGVGKKSSRCSSDILNLVRLSNRIVGFDLGRNNDVTQYDRDYYCLKAIARPMVALTSSDGALFHNLNTGSDGVLSDLAYVAPHEVCALFEASQIGDFFEAQAIHNKLAPLIDLLSVECAKERDIIMRLLAYERGLLATTLVCSQLSQTVRLLAHTVQRILGDIQLKPISWV
jgi:dihydrodipicolinate synthase/N-acetylneuraminate lyase